MTNVAEFVIRHSSFVILLMPDYAGEKTLEPTPHRRQQARREGHVAKSHDLGSAGLLLAGLAVLVMLGGGLVGFMVEYCRTQLGGEPWLAADADFAVSQWNATLWALGRYLLPILGLLCLAGVAVNVLQIGFLFLPQRLAFDFARLDPLQGLRRIFSAASMVHLGFGIVKLMIVLWRGVRGAVRPARGDPRAEHDGAGGHRGCKWRKSCSGSR